MKRLIAPVLLLALIAAAVGCAEGRSYTRADFRERGIQRVAIVDVTGDVDSANARNQLAGLFGSELQRKGYTVMSRPDAQAELTRLGYTGTYDRPEDARQIGQALGADAIMLIDAPTFGQDMEFRARLIDTDDGEAIWTSTGDGSTRRTVATVGGAAAGAVVGGALGGSERRGTGAVIGGAAGAAGGWFLSPDQEDVARDVVREMMDDFPPR